MTRNLELFRDDIRIDGGIITLNDMTPAILKFFYSNSIEKSPKDIVVAAAKVVSEELGQCQSFKVKETYPSFDELEEQLKEGDLFVPLLYHFLKILIPHTQHQEQRITSLIHAIVHANKPRTTLPTLQLGLSVQLHHTEGSRKVLEQLFRMGFCSSYF